MPRKPSPPLIDLGAPMPGDIEARLVIPGWVRQISDDCTRLAYEELIATATMAEAKGASANPKCRTLLREALRQAPSAEDLAGIKGEAAWEEVRDRTNKAVRQAGDAARCAEHQIETRDREARMVQHLQARHNPDLRVYLALHGGCPPEDGEVPPYSTDEAVILAAIQAAFEPVEMTWKNHWKGTGEMPHLVVRRHGRRLFKDLCEGTRAETLCDAAIRLAALQVKRLPAPDVRTGFYWFKPRPGVYFYPERNRGCPVVMRYYPPFAFSSSEPVPVFVSGTRSKALVTGVGSPLDWPDNDGAVSVPIQRLPGEFGPRIDPPADWHADYHVERQLVSYELPDEDMP